jgi:hypothetical protein
MSKPYVMPHTISGVLGRITAAWFDIEGRELPYLQSHANQIVDSGEAMLKVLNGIIDTEDAGINEDEKREAEIAELGHEEP